MLQKQSCVASFFLFINIASFAQSSEKFFVKPNVIFILADDMGYGDISCYNPNARIQTPNIDGLADAGLRFTAGHSTSSVCTPSRYSILTGRYNWRTSLKQGVLGAYSPPLIPSSRMTIADLFKQNGYRTACIGKWHLGLEYTTSDNKAAQFNAKDGTTNIQFDKPLKQSPNDLGFDYYYGVAASLDMPPYMYIENKKFIQRYDTIKGDPKFINKEQNRFFRPGPAARDFTPEAVLPDLTEKAKSYIEQQSKQQPFFLYFPLTAPHTPISPSASYVGKSGLHSYLDFCMQVDDVVGEIVNTLKKAGLYDNTLIVFTSDNGYAPYVDVKFLEDNGHYPSYIYRGYKADAWEGGHRVPLVIQWPAKVASHNVTNEVVSLADWYATFAAILNNKPPSNAAEDSYSLLPLLLGNKYTHPLREATVFHTIKGDFAIQKENWKLILCSEKNAGGNWVPDKRYKVPANIPADSMLLYNLEIDPEEVNNLVSRYREKAAEMKSLLKKYIKNGRSNPGKAVQNDQVKQWPQVKSIGL